MRERAIVRVNISVVSFRDRKIRLSQTHKRSERAEVLVMDNLFFENCKIDGFSFEYQMIYASMFL